jgi:hypothetical protein
VGPQPAPSINLASIVFAIGRWFIKTGSLPGIGRTRRMIVGSCKIELRIPDSRSLKEKRRVVKSLKDRVQSRFNVGIAEVDRLDDWQRATLGVAAVSNDSRLVDETLSKVVNWIEANGEALVVDYEIDLVTH